MWNIADKLTVIILLIVVCVVGLRYTKYEAENKKVQEKIKLECYSESNTHNEYKYCTYKKWNAYKNGVIRYE